MTSAITATRPQMVGTAEAAEYLGVHRNTVHAMIRDGRLPAVKLGSGLRFRLRDLEALTTPGAIPVTVSAGGLDATRATVTIGGETLCGDADELSTALWNVPECGGVVEVGGDAIHVPHAAAGQRASANLAGFAITPGGGGYTEVVRPGDQPFDS